jgi:hypothetical protein
MWYADEAFNDTKKVLVNEKSKKYDEKKKYIVGQRIDDQFEYNSSSQDTHFPVGEIDPSGYDLGKFLQGPWSEIAQDRVFFDGKAVVDVVTDILSRNLSMSHKIAFSLCQYDLNRFNQEDVNLLVRLKGNLTGMFAEIYDVSYFATPGNLEAAFERTLFFGVDLEINSYLGRTSSFTIYDFYCYVKRLFPESVLEEMESAGITDLYCQEKILKLTYDIVMKEHGSSTNYSPFVNELSLTRCWEFRSLISFVLSTGLTIIKNSTGLALKINQITFTSLYILALLLSFGALDSVCRFLIAYCENCKSDSKLFYCKYTCFQLQHLLNKEDFEIKLMKVNNKNHVEFKLKRLVDLAILKRMSFQAFEYQPVSVVFLFKYYFNNIVSQGFFVTDLGELTWDSVYGMYMDIGYNKAHYDSRNKKANMELDQSYLNRKYLLLEGLSYYFNLKVGLSGRYLQVDCSSALKNKISLCVHLGFELLGIKGWFCKNKTNMDRHLRLKEDFDLFFQNYLKKTRQTFMFVDENTHIQDKLEQVFEEESISGSSDDDNAVNEMIVQPQSVEVSFPIPELDTKKGIRGGTRYKKETCFNAPDKMESIKLKIVYTPKMKMLNFKNSVSDSLLQNDSLDAFYSDGLLQSPFYLQKKKKMERLENIYRHDLNELRRRKNRGSEHYKYTKLNAVLKNKKMRRDFLKFSKRQKLDQERRTGRPYRDKWISVSKLAKELCPPKEWVSKTPRSIPLSDFVNLIVIKHIVRYTTQFGTDHIFASLHVYKNKRMRYRCKGFDFLELKQWVV